MRDFDILWISDLDEGWVRVVPRGPEHRHEECRHVAADARPLLEGEDDVVWFVSGGGVLQCQAHVADALGDEVVEGDDAFAVGFAAGRELLDGLGDCLVHGEVWFGKLAIPP